MKQQWEIKKKKTISDSAWNLFGQQGVVRHLHRSTTPLFFIISTKTRHKTPEKWWIAPIDWDFFFPLIGKRIKMITIRRTCVYVIIDILLHTVAVFHKKNGTKGEMFFFFQWAVETLFRIHERRKGWPWKKFVKHFFFLFKTFASLFDSKW